MPEHPETPQNGANDGPNSQDKPNGTPNEINSSAYPEKPHSDHWADIYAHKIVREREKANGQPFVCASGITPSGTVHIGNFREIISVELVVRALRELGAPVRFIYSWDDYDVFRKVPENMPEQERLARYLRQPITRVPNVLGVLGEVPDATSYAEANERALEKLLPQFGITPEYRYQAQKYQSSTYAAGIRQALEARQQIRSQLNEHRSAPLPPDWWPISLFCGNCHTDQTRCTAWDGEWLISYSCDNCGHTEQIDLRRTGLAKLPWRIDWPMRWAYEGVDFEPAGKDHHSEGGSFTTAAQTSRSVYNFEPPITFQYDFVRIKGLGGKISSSSGEVLSLADLLQIYPAEIIRFLFVRTRPNAEFAISFDLDVLKIYDDFMRCEAAYYEAPKTGKAAKKQAKLKRIYELSQVGPLSSLPKEQPFAMPLRHLCNLLQIYDGNWEAVAQFLQIPPNHSHNWQRLEIWAACAWNWVQEYAPQEFRFRLRKPGEPLHPDFKPTKAFADFLPKLRECLKQQLSQLEGSNLSASFYDVLNQMELESKDIFPQVYQMLICRPDGPRLIGFIEVIHSAISLNGLLELLTLPGEPL